MVLALCNQLKTSYICTSFMEIIFMILKYRLDTISKLNITKGCNSINVGRVMNIKLCTSFDHTFNLNQVLRTYLKGFQSYYADTIYIQIVTKGHIFV